MDTGDQEGDTTTITIISGPDGFDDHGFNEFARAGLNEAEVDFDIDLTTVKHTDPADYETIQQDVAETDPDLIVCVGGRHTDPLVANAPQYPDQYWMLVDDHAQTVYNVSGWGDRSNELGFLAGVAAGTLTHEAVEHQGSTTVSNDEIVGFVGGVNIDVVNAYERSYIEGVRWVDEEIEVLTDYGSSFQDPSTIADAAESQFDAGADVIWHAAADAGVGVFQAARDTGHFALGIHSDESRSTPESSDVILGSAITDYGVATYEVAKAVHEGTWEEVIGEQYLGVANAGIDFVAGQEFEGALPDRLDENVDAAKDALAGGDVDLTCGPMRCSESFNTEG